MKLTNNTNSAVLTVTPSTSAGIPAGGWVQGSYPGTITHGTITHVASGTMWAEEIYTTGGKPLSSAELSELAKKVVTVFPEDATLVMVVDANWSDYQLSTLEAVFRGMSREKILLTREPRKMAMVKDRTASTEEERIDFLARIGIVWENNPGLTLTEIIRTMMGAPSAPLECADEVLVSALELAWE